MREGRQNIKQGVKLLGVFQFTPLREGRLKRAA